MRLSPNGRRYVYVAGKGLRPARPMVTVRLEDGVEVSLEPGHSPRWVNDWTGVFGSQEDGLLRALAHLGRDAEGKPVVRTSDFDGRTLSGNSVTAASGRLAVHRTDPRRILSTFRAPILGATDPVLSDDGDWLAYLLPDQPPGLATLVVERADGEGEPRVMATGAVQKPRFGGRTLVWEAGNGVIGGCADVGNPHVAPVTFNLPAWRCYEPVPVWVRTGSALLVLFLADRGDLAVINLAEWASLQLGEPAGYPLGQSTGSGYEHDARPLDGGPLVRARWLTAEGNLDGAEIDVRSPRVALVPPVKPQPPAPPPDIPWKTDPNGVIEDISAWLFSPDQGPDVHIATAADGRRVRFFCKSTEGSGDGPGQYIGEHWDEFGDYIGHLEDASTGRRIHEGRDVTAEDIVAMFPSTHARVWAGLKLQRNWFVGDRLWMPRRLVSGTRIRYRTDITWTVPPRETPNTRVWGNITIDIHIDVGYGRYKGREVRARVAYIPNGNPEINYYGEPNGQNAWVIAAGNSDPWSEQRRVPPFAGLLSAPPPSLDPRAFVRVFRPGVESSR